VLYLVSLRGSAPFFLSLSCTVVVPKKSLVGRQGSVTYSSDALTNLSEQPNRGGRSNHDDRCRLQVPWSFFSDAAIGSFPDCRPPGNRLGYWSQARPPPHISSLTPSSFPSYLSEAQSIACGKRSAVECQPNREFREDCFWPARRSAEDFPDSFPLADSSGIALSQIASAVVAPLFTEDQRCCSLVWVAS